MSYRVLRQLAGGGFSEIFEVEDPASALPERLILKRLTAEMSARPDVQAAFSEEAKILRELKHANVVTFRRCYFDEQRRICLLMEKVTGESLDSWARRHASRPEVVLDLFSRVLGAVDYLHHRPSPFLHLDLKPDNVLVTSRPEGPEPVLIDFGIARRSGAKGLKAYTPPYGAPEQETGGTLDCSTDVYALGQLLKEFLEILKGLPDGVGKAAAGIVEKATRPSRRERYADAGEMRIAFRRSLLARTDPEPAPGILSFLSQLPRWVLPAGAAGLGLVLLAMFLAIGGPAGQGGEPIASEPVQGSATPSGEEKERFIQLQYRFEEALIEGEPSAESYFRAAYDLSDKVPEGSETWNWMKQELDTMSAHLSQAQSGGQVSEELRAVLRQKHLTYQKP